MEISFFQKTPFTCPQCNRPFEAEIWLIVDSSRPDLLDLIRKDTIHDLTCPTCNQYVGKAAAPLLLYCPNETPPLLYSPTQQARREQRHEQLVQLIDLLHERLGDNWNDSWPAQGVASIPRAMLRATLSDDPETAIRQLAERGEAELEALSQRDPESYDRLVQEAGLSAQQFPSLLQALQEFAQAPTWTDSYCHIKAHAELLSDEADRVLERLILGARLQGNSDVVRILEDQQNLLRRCREVGIERTFEEIMGIAPEKLEATMKSAGASNVALAEFKAYVGKATEAISHYKANGDLNALESAITIWVHILGHPAFTQTPKSFQLAVLSDAGYAFMSRYKAIGQLDDLNQGIGIYQRVIETAPSNSPELFEYFRDLGSSLLDRYDRSGQLTDLDQGIEAYQRSIELTPIDASILPARLSNLGIGLLDRYRRLGRLEDLEQAVGSFQDAIRRTPADSPQLPHYLTHLGSALDLRYEHTGRVEDLEQAISICQEAVTRTPTNSPDISRYLTNLSLALLGLYNRLRRLEDLEQAISICQEAVTRTPSSSPDLPVRLNSLGGCLQSRYDRTEQMEDLEHMIEVYQEAVAHTPPYSPRLPTFLGNLALSLSTRYKRTGTLEDLERAITISQDVVALDSANSPDLPKQLTILGSSLRDRYERTGSPKDLEQAIEVLHKSVQLTPPGAPDRATYLNNLGQILQARYKQTKQLENLDQAIGAYQDAIACTPTDSPSLSDYFARLGFGLNIRFSHTKQLQDREQAIEAYQKAVQFTPANSSDLLAHLTNLGKCLQAYYVQAGQLENLERAIETWQEVVTHTPIDSPDLPACLSNLGTSLYCRYEQTGQPDDLERAIEACQNAVEHASADSPDLPDCLISLGGCLQKRYERTGQLHDLERAIEAYQEAVTHSPADSSSLASAIDHLSSGLSARYARTGILEDLQQMVEGHQKAVQLTPPDSPGLPFLLNNWSAALVDRYERTGQMHDLEQAIEAIQKAVQLTPPNSPALSIHLSNLGSSLRVRCERTRSMEDLEQAIKACERAVQLTPSDSPVLAGHLTNLGNALFDRYGLANHLDDLEQAIEAFQKIVQLTPIDSPDLPEYLSNLSMGLLARYRHSEQPDDLEQAIELSRKAVQLTLVDSPASSLRLRNLGLALSTRYRSMGRSHDLQQAIEAYEESSRKGLLLAPEETLTSTRFWGSWAVARENWAEAARAFTYGVQAIEQLYRVQLLRSDQETWLSEVSGLHTHAAYALARAGNLREATITLERGRARGLSEALARDYADLKRIQQEFPEASDYYQKSVERLRQLERIERGSSLPGSENRRTVGTTSPLKQIHEAREELEQAITRIRQIPGYKDFLGEPTYDDIAKAVQPDVPLTYLVTTQLGSMLLLVHATSDTPEVIWANSFTRDDLDTLLIKNAGETGEIAVSGYLPAQLFNPKWLSKALAEALPQLGKQLIEPIVARLRALEATQVVLIPTELLGLLPLHAARYQLNGKEVCLLDEFTVAYAPSARVLTAVRHEALLRQNKDILSGFVGLGNPLPDLEVGTQVQDELRRIVAVLQGVTHTFISRMQATTATNSPGDHDRVLRLTILYEETLRHLQLLCQEPSSKLIYAGRELQRAAVLFAGLPGLPEEVAVTLAYQAARIPPSLSYAHIELENILSLLPVDSATALYEHQATREAFWGMLPQATIAHFSCHGSFNHKSPLDSALLLARETRLTLRDLLNAEHEHLIHLRLAFLSACQTALTGFQRIPDEVVGLLSGFLQAGVPSVVGTLWSVDEVSTALLATYFYELYLSRGELVGRAPLQPAQALRLAQLWLRDLTYNDLLTYLQDIGKAQRFSPRFTVELLPLVRKAVREGQGDRCPYTDPYYWAAFVYYGAL